MNKTRYVVYISGNDAPGLLDAIAKCLRDTGFTILHISNGTGAGYFSTYCVCEPASQKDLSDANLVLAEALQELNADKQLAPLEIRRRLERQVINIYKAQAKSEGLENEDKPSVIVRAEDASDTSFTMFVIIHSPDEHGTLSKLTNLFRQDYNVAASLARTEGIKAGTNDKYATLFFELKPIKIDGKLRYADAFVGITDEKDTFERLNTRAKEMLGDGNVFDPSHETSSDVKSFEKIQEDFTNILQNKLAEIDKRFKVISVRFIQQT